MQLRSSRLPVLLVLGSMAVVVCGLLRPMAGPLTANAGKGGSNPKAAPRTSVGLTVTPLPDWFHLQSSDTVNGWINDLDNKSITAHAWELWGALTTLTDQELNGQKVPIYETWWDAKEALSSAPRATAAPRRGRQFERPRQFEHLEKARARAAITAERPPETLFDDVKYNDDIKQFIANNKYNNHQELDRINNSWGKTKPVAER
ncbi:MAG: hypothetical protein JO112_03905, partial [Planctomycetes bacterium]|nr:hypothetical protein [Planctomycetota bacterium]